MREALKKIGGNQRHIFYGTFERYGIKNGYKGPTKTVLLICYYQREKLFIN